MESLIKETSAKVFDVNKEDITIVNRLMGGMSNYTYIIKVNDNKYTFRIPGKNAELFVNREEEKMHLNLIENLNINNETLYIDITTGIKIAKYVEGSPLHELNPLDYLTQVSDVLHKFHKSNILSKFDYSPYDRLEKYENLCKEIGFKHKKMYYEVKEGFLSYKPFLDNVKKVFCHGDSQVSNFIIGDKIYLTDWEFAGNNDPMYDIACFGNVNFDCAISLLNVYTNSHPSKEEYKRLYLWRSFQCLQWHNVAMYKEMIGLSKELNIDFAMYSNIYLDKASKFLEKVKEI